MEEPYYSDVVNMPTIPPRRSAGTSSSIYPDDEKSYPTNETVSTRRKPLPDDYDDESGRSRSTAIRRSTTQAVTRPRLKEIHVIRHPDRASRLPVPVPQKQVERRNIKIHLSWQAWLIVITILIVGGWLLVNILLSVLHTVSDNLTYGNPRTFQTDKDVGHGGVSHFVAMNLDGHIIVVEIVNHEISTTKVYSIITLSGDGASLAPVTLSFQAMTTPSTLDMVVSVDNGQYVWPNDGKQFQAKTGVPDDRRTIVGCKHHC